MRLARLVHAAIDYRLRWGMRIASWIFVACAVVAALGVFLPAIEVGSHVISRRQTLSLRQAASDRQTVRKLLAAYRRTGATHASLVSKANSHATGALKDVLGDASDAMDTLSGISDDDARHAGTALLVVVWTFVGLCAAMALLIFLDVVAGRYQRWKIITALVIAIVVAAIAIAIRYALGEVAFEANDEIGREAIAVGSAATVIPVSAVGAVCAIVTLLVMHVRSARVR
jgi:hypothetical protein